MNPTSKKGSRGKPISAKKFKDSVYTMTGGTVSNGG